MAVVLAASPLASAQDAPDRVRLHRRPPLRVDIVPHRMFRQCTDWLAVEHRATGDTVVPRTQCWWAVR
jgi:hypothetical protein